MTDKVDIDLTGGAATATDAQAEEKRKLAKRMGLAVVMIAILLGTLAVFDQLSRQPESIEPPAPRPPIPLPRQEMAKAVKAPEIEKISDGSDKAGVSIDKAVVQAPAAPSEPPPRPDVQAQPAVPERAAPAVPRAEPAAPRPAPAKPAAVQEETASPVAVAPAAPPPAASTEPAKPATPTPLGVKPAPSRLLSGYLLQAGVFSSAQRAEELFAKLQLNGIPAAMEARVQAGPFKTRAEAEAAREKLKALGIEAVLMPPKGSR